MARFIYEPFAEKLLDGTAPVLTTSDVGMVLVNEAGPGTLYTPDATHEFLSSVPSLSRVDESTLQPPGTGPYLAGKLVTSGIFTGNPLDFTAVNGDVFEAVILFVAAATEGASQLICHLDSGTGLPFTPSGGKITITPDPVEGFFNLAAQL